MMNQNTFSEKLEFRQIVLGHLKRILEISSHELRDSTTITTHGSYTSTEIREDTRNSYVQSIENLAYVLLPYFDENIQPIYDKSIKVINAFAYEIREQMFKEQYKKICSETNKVKISDKIFAVEMKLKYAKKLFVALNLLLKRNDYLKTAVYGEDKDEVVSEDD